MSNEIVSGKFGSLSPENYTMELISLCIESGMLNTAKQLEIKKPLKTNLPKQPYSSPTGKAEAYPKAGHSCLLLPCYIARTCICSACAPTKKPQVPL